MPLRLPKFTAAWLLHSYIFLLLAELLDGLTTKIGFDFGLTEVGYLAPVAVRYGFWGLMALKFGAFIAISVVLAIAYFHEKRKHPERLRSAMVILTVACVLASIFQFYIDARNVVELQHFAHDLKLWGLLH